MNIENNLSRSIRRSVLFSSFIGWMFDGFETSTLILVGPSAVASFQGHTGPDAIRLAVGTALGSTLLGWAAGGIAGSIAADYIGRKKMLIIAIAGYCALTALTAISQSLMMLVLLRFLTGIFLGSEWSTGTALVAEAWPPSSRAKALGVMQSGYGFGFFIAAGLWLVIQQTAGPEGWRWMFVIGTFPALALLYVRGHLPESGLWLEATGQSKAQSLSQAIQAGPFTLTAVFRDKVARQRMAGALILSAVTVSVFYGASALIGPYIGALAAKRGLVPGTWASISALIYNAGAILGYISAGFIADAVGRKRYMAFTFAASIGAGLLIYLMPGDLTIALICIFILGCFTLGVFSWMPIYLPELFATRVRSSASGFIFNLARFVAFPIPILTAFLFARLGGFQPTILCLTGLYAISLVVLFFLPETKDEPLPL